MQFSNVVGQDLLKKRLIEEVQENKISHAQLFVGRSGFGALPLALAFIQYIFCENKGEHDSCGNCPSCRKTHQLQHPDLHFSFPVVQAISKVSDTFLPQWRSQIEETPYFNLNTWIKKTDAKERKPIIGKDESQEIIKKLSLRSYEGGYKVMVIWMAEEMNTSCANKLLKIIEEPPANTLFILIAESIDHMLPTILSRTQHLRLPRVEVTAISKYLTETHHLGKESADSIASRSEGDVIEALTLAGEEVGDVNNQQFIQLMRVCYKKNVLEMMKWAEDMAATSREQQRHFIKYALHMFRQSLLRNYTADQLTRVSESEDRFLENFARFITGNNIRQFTETFDAAHYHIERNANTKILFTNLCFQVMRFIHAA